MAPHGHKYILRELCAGVSDYLINYLSYALKIAGPKNFFIDLVRPKVELNHDSCIFLGRILPLEIFGHKITIF